MKTEIEKMKRILRIMLATAAMFSFIQCDDSTDSVGSSIIPDKDRITAETKIFNAESKTLLANDS